MRENQVYNSLEEVRSNTYDKASALSIFDTEKPAF